MSNPQPTLTKRRLRAMLALCEGLETRDLEQMEQHGLKLRDLHEDGSFKGCSAHRSEQA